MSKTKLMLIVDDEESSRAILSNLFYNQFDIVEARNGKEALEQIAFHSSNLSVILLDLIMPVLDGYSVLEQINHKDVRKETPIVVLTADASIESDRRLVDLGICHIIHKPIRASVVQAQIQNIVHLYEEYRNSLTEYMLQNSLIESCTNTFAFTYRIRTHTLEIGDDYRNFMSNDFPKIFESYPFHFQDFVLPMDLEAVRNFFDYEHNTASPRTLAVRFRIDSFHYEWFKISLILRFDADGQPKSLFLLFNNIEDEVDANRRLTFMANNDTLTHIPNIHTFEDDVEQMLLYYPDEDFVLLTMDIYQFRLVNNLYGSREGDGILVYLATKLQEAVEGFSKGLYCRMSSDIFYAFLPATEDLDGLLDHLQDCMRQYPINFDLKLCFGVFKVDDREEVVEQMINHSSYARQEAKKATTRYVVYYDDRLREREYFEALVISEMETALQQGQFEIYLQPKCCLSDREITGAEALVRWKHPEMGYLSPGIFIPIFEQNGFITKLDFYVYDQVCQTLRRWIDAGFTPPPISVNVSRVDLYDPCLTVYILELVERYRLPHNLIEFEITESNFISDFARLLDFVDKLHQAGFRISMDDFGSGYSSLNSLKDILVDEIKIDIRFLPASITDKRAITILASVIHMAQKLKLDVIAEGVETQEQAKVLEFLDCPIVQGYLCYRPMPVKEFEALLEM